MKKKLLLSFMALLTASGMWAADGDTFKANTIEGVEMTFTVISEADKTCYVGGRYGGEAISTSTSGAVTIPSEVNGYRVVEIVMSAFLFCNEMTNITIPNSVETIGPSAFEECNSLTDVIIPEGVKTIEYWAFYGCQNLKTVSFPSSLVSIGHNAFYYCSQLSSVSLPESIESIGNDAFGWCTGLNSISVPTKVIRIGERAFHGTAWYQNQPNGVVYLGSILYDLKGYSNSDIIVKEGTLGIADNPFETWSGKVIAFYEGIKHIGNKAFKNKSITSIIIPASVETMGNEVFLNCSSLSNITFSGNVEKIGYQVFTGTPWLNNRKNQVIYVGDMAYSYNGTIPQNGSITLSNEATRMRDSLFYNQTGLESITFNGKITSISESAFEGCTGLTTINSSNNITTIGKKAFYGCTGLTSFNFPQIAVIGDGAFTDCTGFSSISFPSTLKEIEARAFEGCTSLSSVQLPNGLLSIGAGAFSGCKKLSSMNIPNSVQSIGGSAFYECNISSISIPEGITEIYASTFAWSGLKTISLPSTLKTIGEEAFYATRLDNLQLPSNLERIERLSIVALSSLTIPSSVKHIASRAFQGIGSIAVEEGNTVYNSHNNCNAIIETATNKLIYGSMNMGDIPEGIKAIGSYAVDMSNPTELFTIPSTVTSIEENGLYTLSFPAIVSYIQNPMEIPRWALNCSILYVPKGTKSKYQATSRWYDFKIVELENCSVTLNKNVVTFASDLMLDFSTPIDGLKAYVVSDVTDGKATLTEVTGAVPAGTGLLLKGTAGQTYEIPYTIGTIENVTNKLVGVTIDTAIGGNDVDYILSNGKFVKASAGTLAAGKAYLKLDAALARGTIDIVGDATGIDALLSNKEESIKNDEVYNLNGQRVSKPAKGLYVVGGKKVMVK